MRVIDRMAGVAICGRALVNLVDMATLTGRSNVFACQFESCQIVVHGGRSPAGGSVAGTTSGAKAAFVGIFYGMAGIAVTGYALKNMIDMAARAGNIYVLTIQFECGQVVVKSGWGPTGRDVAGTAIGA